MTVGAAHRAILREIIHARPWSGPCRNLLSTDLVTTMRLPGCGSTKVAKLPQYKRTCYAWMLRDPMSPSPRAAAAYDCL